MFGNSIVKLSYDGVVETKFKYLKNIPQEDNGSIICIVRTVSLFEYRDDLRCLPNIWKMTAGENNIKYVKKWFSQYRNVVPQEESWDRVETRC